jgi:hypothetical protein
MRSVIGFWWFPDEEESFLEFLDSTGPILALPRGEFTESKLAAAKPLREFISAQNPRRLLLVPSSLTHEIVVSRIKPKENEGTSESFYVDDMCSPALGYRRASADTAGVLHMASLHGYWDYPNESASGMVLKSPEFVKWGKLVISRVRRMTPKWHQYKNYRASDRVKEALLSGLLQVSDQ